MNEKPFKASDGPMLMLIAFALMLVAQVVMSVVLLSVDASDTIGYEIAQCISMIVFQLVYFATYFVYVKKKGIKATFSLKNGITVRSLLASVAIAAVCFFGFIGLAYYFEYLLSSMGYFSSGLEISSPVGIVLLIIATVIAAPICEETIFRNALCSGLIRSRRDELGVSVISGLCFALMHVNPEQTIYQFCLGTVSAYVMLSCRNVLCSMIIHALSNALALLLSYSEFGLSINGFYSQIGDNAPITLLTCVVLPAAAVAIVWFICKKLKKIEKDAFSQKYKANPQVIWIDENTLQPIYEGDSVPQITEENRYLSNGYNPYTGAPVIVDRLERQKALMQKYKLENGDKAGGFGKNTYRVAFIVYFCITAFLWFITFIGGLILY